MELAPHMTADPLHQLLPYLPLVIVIALLIRRTQRPRVIRPIERGPPVHWLGVTVIPGAAVAGAALADNAA
jgi:hypothetical protein